MGTHLKTELVVLFLKRAYVKKYDYIVRNAYKVYKFRYNLRFVRTLTRKFNRIIERFAVFYIKDTLNKPIDLKVIE